MKYPNARVKGLSDGKARILLEVKESGIPATPWVPVWFGRTPDEWYEFTLDEAIRRVKDQDWTAPKQPKDGK